MKAIVRFLHRLYKATLSRAFGNRCRFHPSCSDYFLEAVEVHGFTKGSVLGVIRIFRCNPLAKGWHDPVPPKLRTFNSFTKVK